MNILKLSNCLHARALGQSTLSLTIANNNNCLENAASLLELIWLASFYRLRPFWPVNPDCYARALPRFVTIANCANVNKRFTDGGTYKPEPTRVEHSYHSMLLALLANCRLS